MKDIQFLLYSKTVNHQNPTMQKLFYGKVAKIPLKNQVHYYHHGFSHLCTRHLFRL